MPQSTNRFKDTTHKTYLTVMREKICQNHFVYKVAQRWIFCWNEWDYGLDRETCQAFWKNEEVDSDLKLMLLYEHEYPVFPSFRVLAADLRA